MIYEKKAIKFDESNVINMIFLIMTSFIVAYYVLSNTMFNIEWPEYIMAYIRGILFLIIIVKLLLIRTDIQTSFMLGFTAAIFYITYCHDTSQTPLVILMLLIVGAVDIPIKRIALSYFIPTFVITICTIVCASLGIIKNLTYVQNEGDRVRYCMGFTLYFWLTAAFFYLVCAYILIREEKISYIELIIIEILNAIVYYICNSRNHLICVTLLVILVAWIKLKRTYTLPAFIKYVILSFSPITCSIASIMAIIFYKDNAVMRFINSLISNRLTMCNKGYKVFGLSLWGQKMATYFSQRGQVYDLSNNTFLVDNTYMYIALKYGIFLLITFILILFLANMRACEEENWIVLIVLSINVVQFIIDRDMFYINCNFLMWCVFSSFRKNKNLIAMEIDDGQNDM